MGGIADYSGALVLQLPLDRATTASLQRQPAPRCDVATRRGDGWSTFSIELRDLLHGPLADPHALGAWFSARREDHWAAYVIGVVQYCLLRAKRSTSQALQGLRIRIESNVPEGKGVSSSAAIEVAQTLAEKNITTRHPIEVVVWQNEEGGLYGSRAVSGQLTGAELKNVSNSGKTIEQGIAFIGGDVAKLDQVRRKKGDIAGYFELHIEQGGTLEKEKIDIGVVEGIVGIKQWSVTITGFQNHAGTTAMDNRHDSLLSAARFIQMVNRVVTSISGRQVGTVGRIQAFPGAPNVIPGKTTCTLELRDLDDEKVEMMFGQIAKEAKAIGAQNGTEFAFAELHANVAAPSDARMRGFVAEAAKALGLSWRVMPSGAGHDAQAMAQLGPMGMIFIPSIGGISHSPKEYSTPKDIVNGGNVLLKAVLAADQALT